jgi:release factor glutamine methyltransferase
VTGPRPLGQVLREAGARLADAGVPSPRVDAELLLAHVLGMSLARLRHDAVLGRPVAVDDLARFAELVDERSRRVPLQHLTGRAAFRRVEVAVGPGVFVPRPETEVLVELALAELRSLGAAAPVVVDLCTGSGAIALAVADEWPTARVHAVEAAPEAHAWAQRNVRETGLPIDLRLGSAQEAFDDLVGTVDVVVSNPPYIPPAMVPVDPEVRDHDPEVALYGGGEDGLRIPLEVARRAAYLLRPGGLLLMEHADSQGEALPSGLRSAGPWTEVADHRDLADLPRVTSARRA